MIRFFLILIFVLVGTLHSFADIDSDTNYVHHTSKKFSVYPLTEFYTSHYHLEFDESYKDFEFLDATYKTQNNVYIGAGMSFYRFGFALSLRLPYSNIPKLKKSKAFSFTGGYSYQKFYGEMKYKHYKGLRRETFNFDNDTTIYQVDLNERIETKQNGLMLYYIASDKYNFDANFKNYNTQRKSATTFVLGGGYNYYNFRGQLDFIDDSDLEINDKNKSIEVYSVKVMPGIATSLVHKHFYFSVFGLMGIGYNYNILDKKNIRHRGSPSLEFRSVLGYNNKNYFFSVNFNYDYDLIFLRKNELGVNNYMVSFKIGMKIDSKHLGKLEPYL